MDVIERLEILLSVMDATQGENSEYSRDVRLGIDRIKELENELAKIKSDPMIGKLEIEEWPESPDY